MRDLFEGVTHSPYQARGNERSSRNATLEAAITPASRAPWNRAAPRACSAPRSKTARDLVGRGPETVDWSAVFRRLALHSNNSIERRRAVALATSAAGFAAALADHLAAWAADQADSPVAAVPSPVGRAAYQSPYCSYRVALRSDLWWGAPCSCLSRDQAGERANSAVQYTISGGSRRSSGGPRITKSVAQHFRTAD
jgi:hypothetical protein